MKQNVFVFLFNRIKAFFKLDVCIHKPKFKLMFSLSRRETCKKCGCLIAPARVNYIVYFITFILIFVLIESFLWPLLFGKIEIENIFMRFVKVLLAFYISKIVAENFIMQKLPWISVYI